MITKIIFLGLSYFGHEGKQFDLTVLKFQKRKTPVRKRVKKLTIMKTYGRPTKRFAMANVRTHALTKKATLLAQRLARRRVSVKMKNFTTSRSRPAMKAREDYRSHLTQIAFNLQKCFIWQELKNIFHVHFC